MWVSYVIVTAIVAIGVKGDEEPRVAIAILKSETVTGYVLFTETDQGLKVTGEATGLKEGEYGFHIHEAGDITSCLATGGHFDNEENIHGGRDHEMRHVGDFGNLLFVGDDVGVAKIDFIDDIVSLRGKNNILGRAVVLHENRDDLGLGNHSLSPITGNAGPRVACGVIGIRSPVTPWNSAVTPVSSLLVLVITLFAFL